MNFKIVDRGEIPDYSFNWPYDYFSIVELVKLDSEMVFESGGPSRRMIHGDRLVETEEANLEPEDEDLQARVENALQREINRGNI